MTGSVPVVPVRWDTVFPQPSVLSLVGRMNRFGPLPVMADSTLTMNDSTVVQIRNGMARMDPADDSTYMVYDTARNILIHVDPGEGTYMELDENVMQQQAEAMGAMREEIAAQMEAMRAELQHLPEDQRRMMEQSMGAMIDAAGNDYQVIEGKTPVADVCIAEKAGAGMSGDDFATLSAMMAFMRSMAQQASEMAGPMAGGFDSSMMADIEGFPVEIKDTRSGEQYGVASVVNGKLSDAPFSEYKKLRKDEMPALPDL